jgi:hypothetical protein
VKPMLVSVLNQVHEGLDGVDVRAARALLDGETRS